MPNPKPLFDLMQGALERAGVQDDQLTAAKVCDTFLEVIEGHPKIKPHTVKPVSYKYRMLTVQVEGAALATELQMRSNRLIATMNRTLGDDAVERIRFNIR